MTRLRTLASLVVVALFLIGSATTENATPPTEPPTLTITVLEGTKEGTPCDAPVERRQGLAPDGAEVMAKVRVVASRPVKMELMEDTLATWCKNRCHSGFTLLRAELEPGSDVREVVALAYRRVSRANGAIR
jgi:hypothetical protein